MLRESVIYRYKLQVYHLKQGSVMHAWESRLLDPQVGNTGNPGCPGRKGCAIGQLVAQLWLPLYGTLVNWGGCTTCLLEVGWLAAYCAGTTQTQHHSDSVTKSLIKTKQKTLHCVNK